MSLLNSLKPEYRSAILATRLYVEPPAKTPAHIKARMVASMTAYCEKRSLSPVEERNYQQAAARFHASRPVSDQTGVLSQIAAFNKRTAKKKMTAADVRSIAAEVPGAPLEEIMRWKKSGYSIDTQNELRLAEITRQVRAGYTGADFSGGYAGNSPRYQGGQAEDPTQSLRDDDDDFGWDDDDWNDDKHERAATFHRACASKAKTMERGTAHFKAADLHDEAARQYPDLNSSFAARAASKALLTLADVS